MKHYAKDNVEKKIQQDISWFLLFIYGKACVFENDFNGFILCYISRPGGYLMISFNRYQPGNYMYNGNKKDDFLEIRRKFSFDYDTL